MENQSKNIAKVVVITVLSVLFIALSVWAGASYVYMGTPWWVGLILKEICTIRIIKLTTAPAT